MAFLSWIVLASQWINRKGQVQWIYSDRYSTIWWFILVVIGHLDKLEITHRHARGPGGQHVNKSKRMVIVSYSIFTFWIALTGVEIRFHIDSATWIPDSVKSRFRDMVCISLIIGWKMRFSLFRIKHVSIEMVILLYFLMKLDIIC